MKRCVCMLLISLLLAVPIIGQYTFISNADGFIPDDSWVYVQPDQQYLSFISYMKNRDIFVDGSIADALAHFTTKMYQELISTVGLDMNQLQNELYMQLESGHISKFGYTATGISAFNTLCAQFLQNYNLSVGDEDVDEVVYSNKWVTDVNGVGCFAWVGHSFYTNITGTDKGDYESTKILKRGTFYKMNSDQLYQYFLSGNSYFTYDFWNPAHNNDGQYSCEIYTTSDSWNDWFKMKNSGYLIKSLLLKNNSSGFEGFGYPIIIYRDTDSKFYAGFYSHFYRPSNVNYLQITFSWIYSGNYVLDVDYHDTDITVTSPKVKGPLDLPPGDEITVINPDGTIDEPEPEPPEPGGDPPDWDLPDGNVTPDGDGGYIFDWDFQLPDLDIDWSIHGLNTKFPLSIPWDIYNLCSTLNAEPVAPEFSGAIDLKIYQWEFDWDLSQFDTVAAILRTMETLVFVIGLAAITRNIIKG